VQRQIETVGHLVLKLRGRESSNGVHVGFEIIETPAA